MNLFDVYLTESMVKVQQKATILEYFIRSRSQPPPSPRRAISNPVSDIPAQISQLDELLETDISDTTFYSVMNSDKKAIQSSSALLSGSVSSLSGHDISRQVEPKVDEPLKDPLFTLIPQSIDTFFPTHTGILTESSLSDLYITLLNLIKPTHPITQSLTDTLRLSMICQSVAGLPSNDTSRASLTDQVISFYCQLTSQFYQTPLQQTYVEHVDDDFPSIELSEDQTLPQLTNTHLKQDDHPDEFENGLTIADLMQPELTEAHRNLFPNSTDPAFNFQDAEDKLKEQIDTLSATIAETLSKYAGDDMMHEAKKFSEATQPH
ncbi:hypothetical protein BLNAU_17361 [Blattamonas nauphoetae]|uniref:Uncharacterized protein n=1 Tax=Blattamonas nauphoetae TaxID=2049346 RepID=A0ABQ9X7B7_9EUKA|nr:hypothetical protein BLNAU_17361 [Blattamonas nauphoetae]